MKYFLRLILILVVIAVFWLGSVIKQQIEVPKPVQLHPENPHYFLYKDKPIILIGSTEHYGAVLNMDFDYQPYLDELQSDGLDLTRTFSGVYSETQTAFGITKNTLAPLPGRYICPWARSTTPGFSNEGNKFDLNRWDDAYFARLKDFVRQAAQRNIIVELVLFCTFYEDSQWNLCPLNAINNINDIGNVPRAEVNTMLHPELTLVQDRMVQKILLELNEFENIYFEVCNEPYFASVTKDWQDHIIETIVNTESQLSTRHLIAQNFTNGSMQIADPNPQVSIFNFHYAIPDAAALNYGFNKAIGDDETGFAGTADAAYRIEAWNFILSGGATFDHLDYSFTIDHENGSYQFPATQPGGGGASMRSQLKILHDYIKNFNFIKMMPTPEVLKGGLAEGVTGQVLAEPGKAYAAYFAKRQGGDVNFALRWNGTIIPQSSCTYTFYTTSDDGVRLWVNDQLLFENWTDHAPVEDHGAIFLQAGQKVKIKVDFYQGTGGAVLSLQWADDGQIKSPIAQSLLFVPDGSKNGVQVELYRDREFKDLLKTNLAANIEFSGSLTALFPQSAGENKLSNPTMSLPAGKFNIEWMDTITGQIVKTEKINHPGGNLTIKSPPFDIDIAVRILKIG
jgi:hypothetical protein